MINCCIRNMTEQTNTSLFWQFIFYNVFLKHNYNYTLILNYYYWTFNIYASLYIYR